MATNQPTNPYYPRDTTGSSLPLIELILGNAISANVCSWIHLYIHMYCNTAVQSFIILFFFQVPEKTYREGEMSCVWIQGRSGLAWPDPDPDPIRAPKDKNFNGFKLSNEPIPSFFLVVLSKSSVLRSLLLPSVNRPVFIRVYITHHKDQTKIGPPPAPAPAV